MQKKRSFTILFMILMFGILLLTAFGCQAANQAEKPVSNLILATTTSLRDSGLLDKLVPAFEKRYPYKVKTLALGTGEALATAARGDADVILVHAPKAELEFKGQGYGIKRRSIAYNYFVIVGPAKDAAGVGLAKDAAAAFKRIAEKKALFISRGDSSGTNKRELSIWQNSGISPSGEWYLEAGQGMGQTLQLASEKQAYTLSDSATFIAIKKRLHLKMLMKQSPGLINTYSVMQVNPAKFKKIKLNSKGAEDFSRFLFSPTARKIIRNFGLDKYGQRLFFQLKKDKS